MPRQIQVTDFNLAATLECGQAFRWSRTADGWFTGIVGQRVCRLRQTGKLLEGDIDRHYLGLDVSLLDIVANFSRRRGVATSRAPALGFARAPARTVGNARLIHRQFHQTNYSDPANCRKLIAAFRPTTRRQCLRFPTGGENCQRDTAATARLQTWFSCRISPRRRAPN